MGRNQGDTGERLPNGHSFSSRIGKRDRAELGPDDDRATPILRDAEITGFENAEGIVADVKSELSSAIDDGMTFGRGQEIGNVLADEDLAISGFHHVHEEPPHGPSRIVGAISGKVGEPLTGRPAENYVRGDVDSSPVYDVRDILGDDVIAEVGRIRGGEIRLLFDGEYGLETGLNETVRQPPRPGEKVDDLVRLGHDPSLKSSLIAVSRTVSRK